MRIGDPAHKAAQDTLNRLSAAAIAKLSTTVRDVCFPGCACQWVGAMLFICPSCILQAQKDSKAVQNCAELNSQEATMTETAKESTPMSQLPPGGSYSSPPTETAKESTPMSQLPPGGSYSSPPTDSYSRAFLGAIPPRFEQQARIENNFKYHAPKEGQQEKYLAIRETAKILAYMIEDVCPVSREQSLAMTNLEQAVMWANASIARS